MRAAGNLRTRERGLGANRVPIYTLCNPASASNSLVSLKMKDLGEGRIAA
jgi:hypothetical protein